MIKREFSVSLVSEAVAEMDREFYGFDPHVWMYKDGNLAFSDGENVCLFSRVYNHIYSGHYFFTARGRKAIDTAFDMLDYVFENTDIEVIRGMSPISHLGARWLNRQLGFKPAGVMESGLGPCEMYLLYKQDYLDQRKTK